MRALAEDLIAHGGEIRTGVDVTDLAELPPSRVIMLDLAPRALLDIWPAIVCRSDTRRQLRGFTYGNAVAKVDFALSDPVPWRHGELSSAGTLHIGGTRAQISRAENTVSRGKHAEHPYVLASQPTVVDPSRAPAGKHVLWTYTHVPRGSNVDQSETVIRQIERYAPGFRSTILATSSRTALQVEADNPNYVGGDIAAGSISMRQLLARPVLSSDPWHTPLHGVYLCSASTPPGPGVHGLCGWQAALSALRNEYGIRQEPDLARE